MSTGKLLPNFRYYYDGFDTKAAVGAKLFSYKASDHSESGAISLYADEACTVPYPNPMIADGLGCIPDPAFGHAIYWKTDDLLYLRLEDANGNLIVDVDNFPQTSDTPNYTDTVFTNYLRNPEFYYHSFDRFYSKTLAQNVDNYIADQGWIFRRNNENCEIYVEFIEFPLGQTEIPDNPKYYMHFEKTAIGAAGETQSDFVQAIPGVENFSGESVSFKFYARSTLNNVAELIIIQHFGTGGSPSSDNTILFPIQLDTDFDEYKVENISIPSVAGKTLGDNNDDCLYIGIRTPLNTLTQLDITKLQINIGKITLAYDFQTPSLSAEAEKTYVMPDINPMILNYNEFIHNSISVGMPTNYIGNYSNDGFIFDFLTKKFVMSPCVPCGTKIDAFDEATDATIISEGYLPLQSLTHWYPSANFKRLQLRLGNIYNSPDSEINWSAPTPTDDTVTVTAFKEGVITQSFIDNGTGFTFNTVQIGDATHKHSEKITCTDTTNLKGGEYFTFGCVSSVKILVYVVIDGNSNVNTSSTDYYYIPLILSSGMTSMQVATILGTMIFNPLIFELPTYSNGLFERVWDFDSTADPDRDSRLPRRDGVGGNRIGTWQPDGLRAHTHPVNTGAYTENAQIGGSTSFWGGAGTYQTGATGGNETRAVNIYKRTAIKY